MGGYHETRDCYILLAELTQAMGSRQFLPRLSKAYQSISGYDSTYIVTFHERPGPVELFDNVVAEFSEATSGPYLRGAYLLDPFYELFRGGTRKGQFSLESQAPDEFFQSEYYRTFYGATQLKDETGIFCPVGEGAAALISLGLHEASAPISASQRDALGMVRPLLTELSVRHWQLTGVDEAHGAGTISRPLDVAFRNFGRDYLSNRECEIVRLVLKGYSSKAIAQLLEISPETVKVYRKRVHSKLEISTQAELFSLFLEAVALAPVDSDDDPLTLYYSCG